MSDDDLEAAYAKMMTQLGKHEADLEDDDDLEAEYEKLLAGDDEAPAPAPKHKKKPAKGEGSSMTKNMMKIMQGQDLESDSDLEDEYAKLCDEVGAKPEKPKASEGAPKAKQQPAKQEKPDVSISPDFPAAKPKPEAASPAEAPKAKPNPEAASAKAQPKPKEQEKPKQPPKQVVYPEKPQPKKKKAPAPPKRYIDEPSTPSYDALLENFGSTFYSFVVSKDKRPEQLEQMQKLVPMVVAGPKALTGDVDLVKPDARAPRYRTYAEFTDKPVCTAMNPSEVDGIIKSIKIQIEELKRDCTQLLKYRDKIGAKSVISYCQILQKSIPAIEAEPYYVQDLAIYHMPELNEGIAPGVMKVWIRKVTGLEYKDPIALVISLPIAAQPVMYRTKEAKPPEFEFSFCTETPVIDLRDKDILLKIRQQQAGLALYSKGNKEPMTTATFFITKLLIKKDLRLSVSIPDFPGATAIIDISMHRAISANETRRVEKPIIVAPSVAFKPAPPQTKAPAKPGQAKPGGSNIVTSAAAAKGQLRHMPASIPVIYVPTEEEQKMFWGIQVLQFWIQASKTCIDRAKSAGVPVQKGVDYMFKYFTAKAEQLQVDIEAGKLTEEGFMTELKKAIAREEKRVPTLPQETQREHMAYVSMMKTDLASFADDE